MHGRYKVCAYANSIGSLMEWSPFMYKKKLTNQNCNFPQTETPFFVYPSAGLMASTLCSARWLAAWML